MRSFSNLSKRCCLFLALIAGVNTARAQYDAMFTQYMFNEMFINPAYAGSKDAMAVTALHRQQWVNFPGRPITTTFSLNGPVMGKKMGVGFSLLNEKIGMLNRNLAYLSYAYRIKTGKNGTLALGLMGGIHSQVIRLGDVKTTDAGDVQFSQNTPNVITPNFGAGIYYSNPKFYAGLSIPRMVDDNVSFSTTGQVFKSTKIDPTSFHYYLTAGGIVEVNDNLKFKPQVMVQAVQNAPILYDITVNALIKNLIWVGVAYRSQADVSGILGVQINPQFVFTYSYDYGLTKIQKYSVGSHEIALGYVFAYKGKKVTSPRYF